MKLSTVSKHTTLAAATIALLLGAACSRTPEATEADTATADASAPASAEQAVAQDAKAAVVVFDINSVPVSTVELGEFPYIGLPMGYQPLRPQINPFERVPFWTGDRVEWVEGHVYGAGVQAGDDHTFSQLELSRNIQAVIESLGGQRVFNGKIPTKGKEEIGDSSVASDRVDALGDIYNEPAEVYVIRRADRNIWLHTAGTGYRAGLLIAETKPLEITAKALPAAEQKPPADADDNTATPAQP